MELTGETLLGASAERGEGAGFHGYSPASGAELPTEFFESSGSQVDRACRLAGACFDEYRSCPLQRRAEVLEAIAEGLMTLGDVLVERATAESGLPRGRIEGERGRTIYQLRMFAALVRCGRFLGLTLDSAKPERTPAAAPDLRTRMIPVGPVAVFGASNFPLAFSVAGGDTASALAAGCPVVVKAHASHPGTCELVGRVIQEAVVACGLPEGVFSLVTGRGHAVGESLVRHSAMRAVGFTGSRAGGMALVALAAARAVPIPVFAEMSSVNPVFLLPAALSARAETIAAAFVESATLGVGQFCTQPGLVFGVVGEGMERFLSEAAQRLQMKPAAPMLNKGIREAYCGSLEVRRRDSRLTLLAEGDVAEEGYNVRPALFSVEGRVFLEDAALAEEVFGPTSIVVMCRDEEELLQQTERLTGELTATLQVDEEDFALGARLLKVLERKAGRVLANGFPTGVEVAPAMVHGGPFPATSDGRSTSVGTRAIERFLRPVCYQDVPKGLLPAELRDDNPLQCWRLVDNVFSR